MYIYFALFVCIFGALIYLLVTPGPNSPKVAEMGRIAYFAGLLVFLWEVGSRIIAFWR